MNIERLKVFIKLLKSVPVTRRMFDLGLIIKEPESKIDFEKVKSEIKKYVSAETIIYDEHSIDEDIFKNIIEAFQKGKWVLLEIKKDLSSPFLNQLKHLVNYNSFQLFDYKGKDVFEMKIPDNCRLIVLAERDFIENQITYPHFYLFFGPTLSIN